MVSVCLPSDALLQHLPSYLGFSYLGHGVSLHSCSSKAQPLLLTLDEGYLLTATVPDLQRGIAPLGPPVPVQLLGLLLPAAGPGLRLGVLASSDQWLVDEIKKDVSIWNINSFAEFFMQIYNKYHKDYLKSAMLFRSERERFLEQLRGIPFLKVYDSEANYFLCEVLPPYGSHELVVTMLKKHSILLKDCSGKKAFDGRSLIRIAVRGSRDNDRLIKAFSSL